MRSKTPTIHCDGDDGMCGAWDVDYYATTVSAIDGVRVTTEARAPGWLSTRDDDLCPDCRADHDRLAADDAARAAGGAV